MRHRVKMLNLEKWKDIRFEAGFCFYLAVRIKTNKDFPTPSPASQPQFLHL